MGLTVGAKRSPGQNANLFKKGKAGGPGRPRNSEHRVSAKKNARAHTEESIAALVEVCNQKTDCRARVIAAEALLNRGWGKPVETQNINVEKRSIRELTDDELMDVIASGGEPVH